MNEHIHKLRPRVLTLVLFDMLQNQTKEHSNIIMCSTICLSSEPIVIDLPVLLVDLTLTYMYCMTDDSHTK